jgi:RNA polymerase sigma-70 factor (ECF subfamily)
MEPSMPSADVLLEHAEFLRRLARGILHDADAADDVAQDAVVAALGDRPKNLRAWLGKVARHLALSRRRAEARRDARERAAAKPERLPSAAEGVARLELQRQVVDAVLALDEPYRSVVVHRFFYDLGPTEIAKQLVVPVGTVRTRLRRALEKLRARLDASHGRRSWSVALLAIAAPRKLRLGGILAMSAKTKLGAASVLLLACAVVGVSMLPRREAVPPRAPAQRHEARVEPEAVAPPAPPAPPVDFATIDRDRDVHGVVVDPAGNPVAGADVRVVRYPAMGQGMLAQLETEEGPGTRTASDGSFALRAERGEEVDLRVKAVGFVELQRRWCPAGGKVRIVMRKGVSLRVRAAGPDGQPVAGVHVIAFKGKEPSIEAAGIYLYLQGSTDEQGVCVLKDLLPSREIQLMAWHPDFELPKPASAKLPETGEVEVQLLAERGRDVTGRVTDAATGGPVADAVVNAYPVVVPFVNSVRTDADGRYRYGAWGGERMIYVHASGYAAARESVGDRAEVDFALRKGGTLKGVVRDARGSPLEHAFVGISTPDKSEIHETWSDAQGRFELRDLGANVYVLVAAKPGFAPTSRSVEAPEIEIVLADARRLEGRVVGFEGEPLGGVLIEAVPASPLKCERHTDDLGRFRFTDLPGDSYVVLATAADRGRLDQQVEIKDADILDLEFRFERGRGFTVRVVDEAGRPVPNVLLVQDQVASSGGTAERRTDADGRAEFELPRGRGTYVSANAKSLDPRFVRPPAARYRPGQGEPQMVLREAAALSGRVMLDGNPLPLAVVRFADAFLFDDITVTDKDGKFSRRIPARSDVTVSLTGQFAKLGKDGGWEDLPIYGEETVRAGITEVTIEARQVPLDRTLVVRVVRPDGTGVEGMQLFLGGHGYRCDKPPVTDAQGRVEVTGLPMGEINVGFAGARAPPPWAMPKPPYAHVEPNGQEVVFTLRATKTIRGVVLMPDGTPAKAGILARRGEEHVAPSASAGEDGAFILYIPADEPEPVSLEAWALTEGGGPRGELDGVVPGAEGVTLRLVAK